MNKITEDANGDGEYIEVTDDGYIILYVRKFSTYAIGYIKADAASAEADIHHGYWWLIPVIVFVMVLIFIIMKKRKEAKD